jgi:hypothetical protein
VTRPQGFGGGPNLLYQSERFFPGKTADRPSEQVSQEVDVRAQVALGCVVRFFTGPRVAVRDGGIKQGIPHSRQRDGSFSTLGKREWIAKHIPFKVS